MSTTPEDAPEGRDRLGLDGWDLEDAGLEDAGLEDAPYTPDGCPTGTPDLGDLIVVLLASTLAGLRDRLHHDGFDHAADLVADLVEAADDYLTARTV